ncbi:MAG TPA: hypothetical protein VJB37_01005 [Patescibacteria group bacterium]|nr:hypothetical protein [Patescibacteria group bacterium]
MEKELAVVIDWGLVFWILVLGCFFILAFASIVMVLTFFLRQRSLVSRIPAAMTVGGIIYEILPVLLPGERYIVGNVLRTRATDLGADLGQKDCQHLLDHQGDIPIPVTSNGKVVFAFPDWTRWQYGDWEFAYIHQDEKGNWFQRWWPEQREWGGSDSYFLRRRSDITATSCAELPVHVASG